MARKQSRKFRRPLPGAAPGTLAVPHVEAFSPVRIMQYGPDRAFERVTGDRETFVAELAKPGIVWFDHDDVPDAGLLESFRELLGLHPLAVADVANVPQRPKHETYDSFDFVVLRMFTAPAPAGALEPEQISLFLGDHWVVTFQERPGDCLEPVRERIRKGSGAIRAQGADYLAYAIIDAIVDEYFPVVETIGDRLEELEDVVIEQRDPHVMRRLHAARRDLLTIRRAIWPLREALAQLAREDVGRFSPQTRVYLRDCYDHTVQLIDLVENYRELTGGIIELHLSAVGIRTNEVMKVLTIISTIFLPLTFIAGVYGMNFDTSFPLNMPELRWPLGYVFSLALMAGSTLGLLGYFRAKGWLGGGDGSGR